MHFNALNDGSEFSWGAHALDLNHAAGLKGNLRKPLEGNKDTARRVGDKKTAEVVVVDYGLQVHGIAQSSLLSRQTVDIPRPGEGGQGPPLCSRWLREGISRTCKQANHRRNEEQIAVSAQDAYP
jgi:hypothetical protein